MAPVASATLRKRIVFVQTVPFEMIGIQSLAAVLEDHELQVVITHIDPPGRIIEKLQAFKPDLVCFSCTTSDHNQLLALARRLKPLFPVPFIWGGPHGTFFPEIIQDEGVDVVVRGEAEHLLPRIVADPLDTSVPSCLFKKADGTIVRNEMGPLLRDLDALPFPDRTLYRRFYADLPYSSLTMVAGRGCPFNCSFCYNRTLKKLFDADLKSGNYVRLRSPARVIEEIEDHVARFGRPDYVKFYDDTFIFHRRWLDEFLDLYIARIRIPFTCLGRADLVDEPLMAKLKEAGLSCFLFAVETGNEQLRRRVLKKGISDAQILECGRLLHKYRVPFRVYNMMGIPEETWEDALSTVELNRRIGNPLPLCTIYDPYPDTELAEVAAARGMLSRPLDSGTFSKIQYASSLLSIDPRILRIQMLFFYFVKFPSLDRLLRWWIRRDHRIVNQLLFYPAYAYVFWRSYKHTVREMIQIVLRSARPLVGLEVEPQDRPASSIAPSTIR